LTRSLPNSHVFHAEFSSMPLEHIRVRNNSIAQLAEYEGIAKNSELDCQLVCASPFLQRGGAGPQCNGQVRSFLGSHCYWLADRWQKLLTAAAATPTSRSRALCLQNTFSCQVHPKPPENILSGCISSAMQSCVNEHRVMFRCKIHIFDSEHTF